ncbi:MAG: cytochrome c [Dehalococcoidia bacterium]|nr:cytochrome c [Dehalococcoidia bacterium]
MRTSRRQSVDRFAASMGGSRQRGLRPARRRPGWFIVPLGGFAVLMLLSFTLIGAIMIRPWAGPDKTWRTHMNLTTDPYSNYSRSVQTFVSAGGSAPIQVWRLARCGQGVEAPTLLQQQFLHDSWDVDSSSCSQQGRAEFVAHGCASCHGLNAQGGTVAPPIAGQKETVVKFVARRGTPGRMPAFSEEDLTPEHLALIAAYLGSLEPIAVAAGTTPTPTPASAPGATPIPTSPAPPLVPLAQIAYDPTWPQWYLTQGAQIYQSKCSACHALPTERVKAFASDKDMVEMEVIMTTGMARLSDEDAAKVIRYLLALRHGMAP